MIKRIISDFGVIKFCVSALCIFAIAGCRQAGGVDDENTISYWTGWTGSDLEVQRRLVEKYEALHPGRKVKLLSVAGAYQKVRIAFAGNDAPDLCSALWPEDVADFAAHGYLEPLDERMTRSGRSHDEWFPAASRMMKVGDVTYGISITCNPFFVLYNRDLFARAGYDDEWKPSSIEDLTSCAARLTQYHENGAIRQLGMLTPQLIEWAPQFGGGFYQQTDHRVTADSSGNVRALNWINGVVEAAGAGKVLAFEQGGGNMQSSVNPFYNGLVAMFVSSIWEESFIERYSPELNYGYFAMPNVKAGKTGSAFVSGSIFVVAESSKKKELTWEFLNWLSSEEASAEFCKGIRNIPAVRKAASHEEFSSPMFSFARTLLENPDSYAAPQMPFWSSYKNELVRAQERVLYGGASASDALGEVTTRIQRQVDELMEMFRRQGTEPLI